MMRNIFFTSDLHFGHKNVAEKWRPFGDVDTMNEALIDNWNAVVGPNDEVHLLGDAVMGQFAENVHLLGRLNGKPRLTPGNHDRVHPAYGERRPHKIVEFTELYSRYVTIAPLQWSKWGFNVCHFPYEGDHTDEERYTEYRPHNDGKVLLHGHVHAMWKVNDRQINVGVDVWDFRPVHLDEIRELCESEGL